MVKLVLCEWFRFYARIGVVLHGVYAPFPMEREQAVFRWTLASQRHVGVPSMVHYFALKPTRP